MQVSLIITTYNWPEALTLSLQSCLRQSVDPLEIIVADDGSGPMTRTVIDQLAASSPVPIIHSWQEDKGFRLAKSRNKAIAMAQGEYILLIDGDIILESHFVEDHCWIARRGCFVQGGRVLLDEHLSRTMLATGTQMVSLCSRRVGNRKNCIRSFLLARLFSLKSRKITGIKTCNFAFWKEDAIAVNGFNEEFIGWGREDSEFTVRLMNSGVKRQNIKFRALAYHLFHGMHDRAGLVKNDDVLLRTRRDQLQWCEKGLNQYL